MDNWKTYYQSRTLSIQDAIAKINPQQNIFIAAYCNEPQMLVEELVKQRNRLNGSALYINVVGSPLLYAQEESFPFFCIRTFLSASGLKNAMEIGDCEYIPVNVSEIPRLISETKVDVALVQVSPPNEEGYCCLGISVDATHTLIEKAQIVIAEVNDQVPFTYGDTMVSVNQIDYFVHSSRKLLTIPYGSLSEVDKKIGENVAELIPDGATIQWGIGNIPNSVLSSLLNRKN